MTGLPPFKLERVTNLPDRPDLQPRLRKLSYPQGHMRMFLHDPKAVALLARGSRGAIYGWGCVYNYEVPIVSVFVHPRFRHKGLGKLLKESIIQEGFKLGYKTCDWQDRHTRDFHTVKGE
jgi:GNAT superfamily N-acetyltransferase